MEQAVADLTVLLESRDWKTVPGDAQLVATLMTTLSTLLAKRQSVKEGVDYLEQEILAAILSLIERIQNAEEIQRAHVGVEVIIKVIRGMSIPDAVPLHSAGTDMIASTNPRTSQRALLVASELARLIPDAVLHNIMPIFTFMSASDLQRDDAYSFGVVEKVRCAGSVMSAGRQR
jgi:U3 small nucleolar RNA-associated protein 10